MIPIAALASLEGALKGGGSTKISTNTANTTSLNISNILSNYGQGDNSAPVSGSPSVSASSNASGQDRPVSSVYPTGAIGYGSDLTDTAESNISANSGLTGTPDITTLLMIGAALSIGAYLIFGRKKRG